jgi:hypothetical protein
VSQTESLVAVVTLKCHYESLTVKSNVKTSIRTPHVHKYTRVQINVISCKLTFFATVIITTYYTYVFWLLILRAIRKTKKSTLSRSYKTTWSPNVQHYSNAMRTRHDKTQTPRATPHIRPTTTIHTHRKRSKRTTPALTALTSGGARAAERKVTPALPTFEIDTIHYRRRIPTADENDYRFCSSTFLPGLVYSETLNQPQ